MRDLLDKLKLFESTLEGYEPEVEEFFEKVAAAGSDGFDMLYDANLGPEKYGNAVYKAVSDMYNDVSVDNGLHPDDDFEDIYDRMMDHIEADYSPKEDYAQYQSIDDSDEQTFEGEEFYEYYGYLPWHEDVPVDEAEYRGRKVPLGKPMRGDVKKFKVYVRDPKTKNVKKVNFGDPNMRIKKSNPKRRKSFRARHNCSNPGPRTKARYWSCRKW